MGIRVGIIGTGRIAARFASDVQLIEGMAVSAVYARKRANAEHFIEKSVQKGDAVCGYDELDAFYSMADAVYIAVPHEVHYAYAKQSLLAGKHVLCEKPMCMKRAECEELYVIAQEKGLVLMEAIKTAACPGFTGLMELIQSGVIGAVHDIEACFTKLGDSAGRELWSVYGGAFTELASYCLLPIVKIFGTEYLEASAWTQDNAVCSDAFTRLTLTYPEGIATVKMGLGVKSEGELIISGEKGYIKVPAPWWLTKKVEIHHENARRVEIYEAPYIGNGLVYETAEFGNRIINGGSEDNASGVSRAESIWMAGLMEDFLSGREEQAEIKLRDIDCALKGRSARIWAHRGCCRAYPENTLIAFEKAAQIPGITGIELDVQLTADGEIVVIHDERLDRTTTGGGYVKDYTLSEIKSMSITPSGRTDIYMDAAGRTYTVPTLKEVFDTLLPYIKENGLLINIELKNSVLRYDGMEEQVTALVKQYDISDSIVYSSFLHESMGLIKQLEPLAKTGILSGDIVTALEGLDKYGADALHPGMSGMPVTENIISEISGRGIPVRMWSGDEPFFGDKKELGACDKQKYVWLGATDIITNVPEIYLSQE